MKIILRLLFKISILLGQSMDYFVMDNPGVDPQVKINAEIAHKLARCNLQMLDIVDTILDNRTDQSNLSGTQRDEEGSCFGRTALGIYYNTVVVSLAHTGFLQKTFPCLSKF